ncbi:MAG: General transcription factor IIH subunit 1 [Marteilia pararefringens]
MIDYFSVQKISPESKVKVQLQLCLKDESPIIFHFVNELGHNAQLLDRDNVKNVIQLFMSEASKQRIEDNKIKSKLLLEDQQLFQTYKFLVGSKLINDDFFWNNLANHQLSDFKMILPLGISNTIHDEISQYTDSTSGTKFNLNRTIIDNIFKSFPAVELKFQEIVPDKMDEKQFWKTFFMSKFFFKNKSYDPSNVLDSLMIKEIESNILFH